MANRKIEVDILANPQGFKKGTSEAAQSASWLEKALGRLGPAGNALQGVLNKVGLSSIGMGAGITGGAVVALGAAYEVGKRAIEQYVQLGESIRNYSILTGQSAEESSRQVQAFQVLNVSEETAAAGVVKLSKAIETAPKKLEALGIEIAHNAQGNVDLGKTLMNVVSAYQATDDAAKKNEIALAAFGRGGAAMIPILEADAAQLKRLESEVSKVYTAADLKRVHDYEISQRELKRSTDELGLNLGQALLPAQKAVVDSMNENVYVSQHLQERTDALSNANSEHYVNTRQVAQALREEYRAAQSAQQQADTLAVSEQQAADAAQAEAAAEDRLYDSLHKTIDANDAYKDTLGRLRQEENTLVSVQQAYNDAVKQYGANSPEAHAAALNLNDSWRQLTETSRKLADAAVAQAEAQAEVNGMTLSAAEKAQIFRTQLQELMSGLAPDSPLRKNLQGYIDELNAIPPAKTTSIATEFHGINSRAGGNVASYDDGGVVPGPIGAPVPAIVHGGEVVLNRNQQLAASSQQAPEIHIHIDGFYSDGPGLDKLMNALARRGTFTTGR